MTSETEGRIFVSGSVADIFFPPGSARGISTSIEQIESGELRRTVNGNLVDLTREELRKYAISLSCDGMSLPGFDSVWRGMICTITPPVRWIIKVEPGQNSVTFARPAANAKMFDAETNNPFPDPIIGSNGTSATFSAQASVAWIEYQPIFQTRVVGRSESSEEWEASATWSLELEEI
ncbi:hypothetical protein [Yoonia sp. 67-2]|nr:hypothetical protein [Yoonia sp. 67-2]